MTEHTLYSGGCSGADYFFGLEALKRKHTVCHYGFNGMHSPCAKNEITRLDQLQLCKADDYLIDANDRLLKRSWPTKTDYGNNLLRRNYYQIKDSERIYAAGRIDDDGVVMGGTGWTVAMGLVNGISEIYFYDWEQKRYFAYDWPLLRSYNELGWWWYETSIEHIPIPFSNYTGIGSHDLPIHGVEAIRRIFSERTKETKRTKTAKVLSRL